MRRFLTAELIVPILSSLAAVTLTTAVLMILDSRLEAQHLVIGYLIPTTLIAMLYGSGIAFLTAIASSMAAAYFLLPPKFSILIASPLHIAELGFFILLAVIAGKATALLTHDLPVRKSPARSGGKT